MSRETAPQPVCLLRGAVRVDLNQLELKRLLSVFFNGYGFALRFEGPDEFRICEVIEPWSSREGKSLIFTGSHAPNREVSILLVGRPFLKTRCLAVQGRRVENEQYGRSCGR